MDIFWKETFFFFSFQTFNQFVIFPNSFLPLYRPQNTINIFNAKFWYPAEKPARYILNMTQLRLHMQGDSTCTMSRITNIWIVSTMSHMVGLNFAL